MRHATTATDTAVVAVYTCDRMNVEGGDDAGLNDRDG